MSELHLDLALARRVERAETEAAAATAEALQHLRPEAGAAVQRIAGGAAVFCGKDSPLTQAVGLGLDGAISSAEIARLEEFYSRRGQATRVELCPLADPSLVQEFGQRGYRVTEFSNVWARPIRQLENWPAPPAELQIAPAAKGQEEIWARIVAQGFAEHFAVTPELLEVMQLFASAGGAECYLANWDGQLAGGGALYLRDATAGLFGASTLPAYRGRGIQTALLRTRLWRAAEARCDLAVSITQVGSTSARNLARQGFEMLYTRVKFEKVSQ